MMHQTHLDATCSRHLRFRDLIECGETWARLTGVVDNTPRQAATWDGLRRIATDVLDPVIDRARPADPIAERPPVKVATEQASVSGLLPAFRQQANRLNAGSLQAINLLTSTRDGYRRDIATFAKRSKGSAYRCVTERCRAGTRDVSPKGRASST